MEYTELASLSLLNSDLEKRINPERSRRFDIGALEASHDSLASTVQLMYSYFSDPSIASELELGTFSETSQKERRRISIVGSNGKGSLAYLLAILSQCDHNVSVGVFSSPHLLDFNERIRIAKTAHQASGHFTAPPPPISAKNAWLAMQKLEQLFPQDYSRWTYFEALTLLAVYCFESSGLRLSIYEAGLGGRWDATRSVRAHCVALTSIALEHTHILGASAEAILKEKLAIMTADCQTLICMPQQLLSLKTIVSTAQEIIRKEWASSAPQSNKHLSIYTYNSKHNILEKRICLKPETKVKQTALELSLNTIGYGKSTGKSYPSYLHENYHCARLILQKLNMPQNTQISMQNIRLPGRLERIECIYTKPLPQAGNTPKQYPRHPVQIELIFDVAHNLGAIQRSLHDIRNSILALTPEGHAALLVLGQLKDRQKDLAPILSLLQSEGLRYIILLTGEPWVPRQIQVGNFTVRDVFSCSKGKAQLSPDTQNPELLQVEVAQLCDKVLEALSCQQFRSIIFLGSHQSYIYFKELEKKLVTLA